MDSKIKYMERALRLAKKGEGYTRPNPMVGAVIVKNGTIVGEGYHMRYGEAHAEINAFNNAAGDVSGAEMYVTLEPCFHFGRTPPCVDEIIRKGISKVIMAMEDPNPLVSGKSIRKLKEHNIEVEVGILKEEALKLNEVFVKYITTKLPFCTMKAAVSIDGKTASSAGDSKWISGEASRRHVHRLRHANAAIMAGIGTVLTDNPMLTARLNEEEGRNPVRIIADTCARIPLNSNILSTAKTVGTIIAVSEKADPDKVRQIEELGAELIVTPLKNEKVDLRYLMKALGERKIDSILLEGGSELNFSALTENIIDKVIVFIAPKIIGGAGAKTPVGGSGFCFVKDAIQLNNINILRFEEDIMIEGYIKHD